MRRDDILALVEPVVERHGLELDALTVTPMRSRTMLRITVDGDGPEGRGPLLDDISACSAEISATLDASDAAGEAPYTLEVTSRGVSAPLVRPAHFRRNRGRLVKFTLEDSEVLGRLQNSDDEHVVVDVDGRDTAIALADIKTALVQIEMTKPPKESKENKQRRGKTAKKKEH